MLVQEVSAQQSMQILPSTFGVPNVALSSEGRQVLEPPASAPVPGAQKRPPPPRKHPGRSGLGVRAALVLGRPAKATADDGDAAAEADQRGLLDVARDPTDGSADGARGLGRGQGVDAATRRLLHPGAVRPSTRHAPVRQEPQGAGEGAFVGGGRSLEEDASQRPRKVLLESALEIPARRLFRGPQNRVSSLSQTPEEHFKTR